MTSIDRAKRGSKRHLICYGQGVPLAVRLTGANRNDSQEALALVDAIPRLQGERGRPRFRPVCVLGDRGYDAAAIRHGLRARHILPLLVMRRTKNGSGLGRWRARRLEPRSEGAARLSFRFPHPNPSR